MRTWGFAPPRLERLLPWLGDNVLASFLVYFVLYDFAAYWLHRAQHAFPGGGRCTACITASAA